MTKRKVYIAGPMRGIPEYNYPAFMAAAKSLRELDFEVFNPAEMDIEHDDVDYAARSIEDQKLHDTALAARRFARRDLNIILSFKAEDGDMVVTLPGWKDSTGAKAEVDVARWVMLDISTVAITIWCENILKQERIRNDLATEATS